MKLLPFIATFLILSAASARAESLSAGHKLSDLGPCLTEGPKQCPSVSNKEPSQGLSHAKVNLAIYRASRGLPDSTTFSESSSFILRRRPTYHQQASVSFSLADF